MGEDLPPATGGDGEVDAGVRLRLEREFGLPAVRDEAPCKDLVDWLSRYLAGDPGRFEGKLDLGRGTDFQRRVWEEVWRIPYGEVRSYGWIAERVGSPNGQRAVGQANGANPIPLAIPCHRVIRSDGQLGGYTCGLGLKERLLAREKARS
ncbi:MAG: methylated-DNA--[protein]-cysteine S-methyltransferase [Candidatus Tectomicrobia bacterium]|uniref:methylated-DNA--[protein]-cysteine S-methyltransferase n=1 Tax=Tectimicrobiota bacterium TaxID=2528274 RepID=A0A932CNI7_UNCTE|nr:methylated-DNA--[protein]-cysteine S-methyltransferase [Candidatus Tectomicrobia bacterium]